MDQQSYDAIIKEVDELIEKSHKIEKLLIDNYTKLSETDNEIDKIVTDVSANKENINKYAVSVNVLQFDSMMLKGRNKKYINELR